MVQPPPQARRRSRGNLHIWRMISVRPSHVSNAQQQISQCECPSDLTRRSRPRCQSLPKKGFGADRRGIPDSSLSIGRRGITQQFPTALTWEPLRFYASCRLLNARHPGFPTNVWKIKGLVQTVDQEVGGWNPPSCTNDLACSIRNPVRLYRRPNSRGTCENTSI